LELYQTNFNNLKFILYLNIDFQNFVIVEIYILEFNYCFWKINYCFDFNYVV